MDFLAGCIGGAAGVLVGHPFDTVKVRLQVQNVDKPLYRGTFHCFQSIVRQESMFGLYKGIGSPMMGLTFINAIVFGVQGNAMRMLGHDTPTNQFAAGAAAGAIQCVICCPMELAKTRMQMQGTGACGVAVGYPLDTVKVRIQTQKQFTGIWQCTAATFAKEGVPGFFKGMSLPITTISMTSSVVFGTYRNCLQCFSQLRGAPGGSNTRLEVFLSGLAGGVAQILVMSPGDMVKVRLQCQTESLKRGGKPKYHGPIHCLLSIAREEGVLGLYRGALPLMLRDGPSFATYFLTYSIISDWLRHSGKNGPEWSVVMLAGGLAGMAGWTVGTPMDVIKARLQMDGAREVRRYRGLFHCITETTRTEGAAVFFRSLGINWIRAFPVNSVVFVTYEVLLEVLQAAHM